VELGAVLEENAARPDAEVERDDGDDEEEMADLDAVVGGGDPPAVDVGQMIVDGVGRPLADLFGGPAGVTRSVGGAPAGPYADQRGDDEQSGEFDEGSPAVCIGRVAVIEVDAADILLNVYLRVSHEVGLDFSLGGLGPVDAVLQREPVEVFGVGLHGDPVVVLVGALVEPDVISLSVVIAVLELERLGRPVAALVRAGIDVGVADAAVGLAPVERGNSSAPFVGRRFVCGRIVGRLVRRVGSRIGGRIGRQVGGRIGLGLRLVLGDVSSPVSAYVSGTASSSDSLISDQSPPPGSVSIRSISSTSPRTITLIGLRFWNPSRGLRYSQNPLSELSNETTSESASPGPGPQP